MDDAPGAAAPAAAARTAASVAELGRRRWGGIIIGGIGMVLCSSIRNVLGGLDVGLQESCKSISGNSFGILANRENIAKGLPSYLIGMHGVKVVK